MVNAVAYYRMSSDKQDTSIGDQKAEVKRLAKARDYKIIRHVSEIGKRQRF